MLSPDAVRILLNPFGLELTSDQIIKLITYLELLIRWNRKINLTAVRTPEECITRHFGESLYLARWVELRGSLVDIGSGAGFPGLALKIAFPHLFVTLLEPVAKKRAFLKEVARTCGFEGVEVRQERLVEFLAAEPSRSFDSLTARAVGNLSQVVRHGARALKPGGLFCLWTTRKQASNLKELTAPIRWSNPIAIPLSLQREIWIGTRPEPSVPA